ncbi:DUF3265 domain-containing protein [Vibrio parahaemolyticus]|nr:DUF3265 domain-containing protein [Vibrio parahaemolyticus]
MTSCSRVIRNAWHFHCALCSVVKVVWALLRNSRELNQKVTI